MELQELVDRIQRWKARVAAEEAGETEVQPEDVVEEGATEADALAAEAIAETDDMEQEAGAKFRWTWNCHLRHHSERNHYV